MFTFAKSGARVLWCAPLIALTLASVVLAVPAGAASDSDSNQSDDTKAASMQQSSGLSPSDQMVQDSQAPLIDVAHRVLDLESNQFAGFDMNPAEGWIRVYWVGEATGALQAIVDESKSAGVRVDVHPAEFSRTDEIAAADQLSELNEQRQLGITVITVPNEGSGLTVRSRDVEFIDDVRNAPEDRSALVEALRSVANQFSIRISLGPDTPAEGGGAPGDALMTGRSDDVTPFWGGPWRRSAAVTAPPAFLCTQRVIRTRGSC